MMAALSDEDIICFAGRRWYSTWKGTQQVMCRLSRTNRVFYVNPPRSLHSAVREAFGRESRSPVLEARAKNLYLYQEPFFLPGWGRNHILSRWYNRIAQRLRISHASRVASTLGFRSPILWLYDPLASPAIGSFGEKLVVYSVIDNYDEYFSRREVWHAWARRCHRALLQRADVVLAVSERLLDQCLQYNRNSYLVPNGVSFELFEAALRNGAVPSDIRPIPRPIIGYAGVLQSVVDFDLLDRIAQEHSDWSLAMIGPVEGLPKRDLVIFDRLRSRTNVYYLGPKTPEALPDYIKCFDIGLMPYRVTPLTVCIDSLKLYEYMACGKPVVSTAIPSARRFLSLIEVADGPSSFLAAIERMLTEPDGLREQRMALAKANSWDHRIDEISAILARYFEYGRARIARVGDVM